MHLLQHISIECAESNKEICCINLVLLDPTSEPNTSTWEETSLLLTINVLFLYFLLILRAHLAGLRAYSYLDTYTSIGDHVCF